MNIKGIVIVIILILGVLFINEIFTIREGADITAESVKSLGGEIKQSMDAAGVPESASNTSELFNQLTNLMVQETSYQNAKANATAEAEKTTPLAGNTIAPTLTNNSFFMGNKFSDPFCAMYSGTSKLNEQCSALTEDSCNLTDCCVYVNGTKCMAGNANGPIDNSNFKIDADYYLYKYQCYGNCNNDKPPAAIVKPKSETPESTPKSKPESKPESAPQCKPQIIDCSEELNVISTTCFNEYGAKLNCSSLNIPNNFTGASSNGFLIANNKLDMSKSKEGINWGMLKKAMAEGVKKDTQLCSDVDIIKKTFNLKN